MSETEKTGSTYSVFKQSGYDTWLDTGKNFNFEHSFPTTTEIMLSFTLIFGFSYQIVKRIMCAQTEFIYIGINNRKLFLLEKVA